MSQAKIQDNISLENENDEDMFHVKSYASSSDHEMSADETT